MTLRDHFVGARADFTGAEEPVGGPAREVPTECAVEVVDLSSGGRLTRMVRLIFLKSRLARARRRLGKLGATAIASYGFYPDLDAPTFVYDLGGAAQRYVERNMLPASGRLRGLAIDAVASWAGCDPRVSAVVVVGSKR